MALTEGFLIELEPSYHADQAPDAPFTGAGERPWGYKETYLLPIKVVLTGTHVVSPVFH